MKKTAFIFAGGGSLGAIQVGMLKALAERLRANRGRISSAYDWSLNQ